MVRVYSLSHRTMKCDEGIVMLHIFSMYTSGFVLHLVLPPLAHSALAFRILR